MRTITVICALVLLAGCTAPAQSGPGIERDPPDPLIDGGPTTIIDGNDLTWQWKLNGTAGEWVAVFLRVVPHRDTTNIDYSIQVQTSDYGPGVYSFVRLPSLVFGFDQANTTFHNDWMHGHADDASAAVEYADTRTITTTFDQMTGVFIAVAANKDWNATIRVTLSDDQAFTPLPPLVLRNHSAEFHEADITSSAPGVVDFSGSWPMESGWHAVFFMRTPASVNGGSMYVRAINYEIQFPGGVTYGGPGRGHGYSDADTDIHSGTLTNRYVGVHEDGAGSLTVTGVQTSSDSKLQVVVLGIAGLNFGDLTFTDMAAYSGF
jgi:hypothetical protein